MKSYVKIKIFGELQCHQKKNKMLEFNQHMTSDIKPYIIYPDIES